MSGKGDKQRPKFVSYQEFSNNWDSIFGKPPKRIEHSDLEKRMDIYISKLPKHELEETIQTIN